QWLQGSTVLLDGTTTSSGATVAISTSGHTSTLTLGGVQNADTGGYTVNVTNTVGAAGLSSATLTVLDPPANLSVVQSPSSTTSAGGITRFTVTADGSPPFTYVWSRNGTPLINGGAFSGADTATLAVNVSPATAGSYT